MSQEKVDKYKKEKADRKKNIKKQISPIPLGCTHALDTKKDSYDFRNCLISFWYRERDLNSQDVAIGGF